MDLESFRIDQNLTYDALALQIGVANGTSARRYCTGEREPRPLIASAIDKATGGRVTVADLRAVRLDYLRARSGQPDEQAA